MKSTPARYCGTKQKHATKDAARQHMYHLLRQGRVRLNVYKCKRCKTFHVGHIKGR